VFEKNLKITNNQGNINQNQNEISTPSSNNSYYQKDKKIKAMTKNSRKQHKNTDG
jgi:hypothetical protein